MLADPRTDFMGHSSETLTTEGDHTCGSPQYQNTGTMTVK